MCIYIIFILCCCCCCCCCVLLFCDSMDCSLPGFPVRGISQARILEWTAISFSRKDLSRPRNQTCISCISWWILLPLGHQYAYTCAYMCTHMSRYYTYDNTHIYIDRLGLCIDICIEKEMTARSSIPAWEIPWTEEPGGLQSMGSPELDTI